MIIELFGAPGVGKTTFARALAARLRDDGCIVQLMLSQRPAERSPSAIELPSDFHIQQSLVAIGRLTRPFVEMLRMASHPVALSHELGMTLKLVRMLPPSSRLWWFRLFQYVSRLSRQWIEASSGSQIVLFDQAFIQAVCSLALLSGTVDELLISEALDEIPQSDLSVRLDAPIAILQARLSDRLRLAGSVERRFELDLTTSLRSADLVACIDDLLRKKGRPVASAASLDRQSLQDAVDLVERQITAQVRQGPVAGQRATSRGSSGKMRSESSLTEI